jgi:hypothetical protein
MLAVGLGVFALAGGAAFGANPPGTGQPNQDCGDLQATLPAPFVDETSAFSTVADAHYADGQLANPTAVSQYDVACFQLLSHG